MAGLANLALSLADAQTVNAGAPASGARGNAPKFRLGDQGSAVFDAVLNNRQPPVEPRASRDPVDRNLRSPDRNTATIRNSAPGPDRAERQDASTATRKAGSERNVSPANDDARVSKPDRVAKPGTSGADRVKSANDADAAGETGAVEEDVLTGETEDTELQTGPVLSLAGPVPQNIAETAEGNDTGQENLEKVSEPIPAEKLLSGIEGGSGKNPDAGGQPEQLPGQISTEEALAADKMVADEAQDVKSAHPGLVAKEANADTPLRQAALAGEAIANPAKKGAGAPVPDADGAAANAQDEAGEDGAPAPKSRNTETAGVEKTAKTDTPPPRPSAGAIDAELAPALRPATPPGQPVQGSSGPLLVDAGSAIFRGSAPAGQGTVPNLPVRAIALHIANKAASGVTKFQIRLDPPELGRIDVKLEIARDGRTSVQLTVDRPETLETLIRDQRGLERTLQNAGLDTAKDGLSFNLRQDEQAGAQENDGDTNRPDRQNDDLAEISGNPATEGPTHVIGLSAIDIRV